MNVPQINAARTANSAIYRERAIAVRPRVTNRLLAASSYPITTIIAPAGFGKTTALRHLLALSEASILIATPPAATLLQFIQVFARACSSLFPEMASPPRELASMDHDVDSVIELHSAWASVHLHNASCTIAIDDLQNADHDHSVATFLSRVVESSKESVKWIFSSRTRGHIPITRWQAYGDADAPVNADDLRMTIDEAKALADSLGSPASSEQIEQWVDQTRGFAVPIAYAIRLSAGRASVDNITDGTRALTFSFLAEQLWVSLSSPERELLEIASFLPTVHMHVFENAGIANASAVISNLSDRIAFLSLASGEFSMHDLFRDFIRQELSLSDPESRRSRSTAAVNTLLRSGHHTEGFQLLIELGNLDRLLCAVEHYHCGIHDWNVSQRIVQTTAHLRPAQLGIRLLYLQTEHWSWTGDTRRARQCAEEIIRRTDSSSTDLLCAISAICKALNFQSTIDQQHWLSLMPTVISRLNETDRLQAIAYRTSLLARYPESKLECLSQIQEVQGQIDSLDLEARVSSFIALGSALYYLHRVDEALAAYREAVIAAQSIRDARQLARALDNYGLMLYKVYDPAVESLFQPLRNAVERTGAWRFSHVSHWLPAQYYALKGEIGAAIDARERQLSIVFVEDVEKNRLQLVRRHSKNLCDIINENYEAITRDYFE